MPTKTTSVNDAPLKAPAATQPKSYAAELQPPYKKKMQPTHLGIAGAATIESKHYHGEGGIGMKSSNPGIAIRGDKGLKLFHRQIEI
jgi:hypothetical protein